MEICWVQRTPNPEVHANDDPMRDRKISSGLRLLKEWEEWNRQFPGQWKFVTLARRDHDGYQLRLWFGEPYSYRPDYVDSMGHNLAVHIFAREYERGDMMLLIEFLLKNYKFEKTTQKGVEVWRIT